MCKPEITHPSLLSLLNQFNKWQLMSDFKSHRRMFCKRATSAFCPTRFHCSNMTATCLACALLRDALCQHVLSTSHSTFPISTTLPPPVAPIHPFPLPLSAHSCSCGFSSPLPLRLVEQQSRWVFSSCYDLRDDNGSYNVASRS